MFTLLAWLVTYFQETRQVIYWKIHVHKDLSYHTEDTSIEDNRSVTPNLSCESVAPSASRVTGHTGYSRYAGAKHYIKDDDENAEVDLIRNIEDCTVNNKKTRMPMDEENLFGDLTASQMTVVKPWPKWKSAKLCGHL